MFSLKSHATKGQKCIFTFEIHRTKSKKNSFFSILLLYLMCCFRIFILKIHAIKVEIIFQKKTCKKDGGGVDVKNYRHHPDD